MTYLCQVAIGFWCTNHIFILLFCEMSHVYNQGRQKHFECGSASVYGGVGGRVSLCRVSVVVQETKSGGSRARVFNNCLNHIISDFCVCSEQCTDTHVGNYFDFGYNTKQYNMSIILFLINCPVLCVIQKVVQTETLLISSA